MKRIFISSLEHSADIAAAELAKSMFADALQSGEEIEIYGIGGNAMLQAGVKILQNTVDKSLMGFTAVLSEIPRLMKLLRTTVNFIKALKIDVVIVIDSYDFHILLAKKLQSLRSKLSLVYFILPKAWAWRSSRTRAIAKYFDINLAIFSFEQEWFRKRHVNAIYVGNPTSERIRRYLEDSDETKLRKLYKLPEKDLQNPIIALMPGSRNLEIKSLLEVQIDSLNLLLESGKFEDLTGIFVVAPSKKLEMYLPFLKNCRFNVIIAQPPENSEPNEIEQEFLAKFRIQHIIAKSLQVMHLADAGIICSGTSTLASALLKLPTIVAYKANALNFQIGKAVIQVKYLSPSNLILDESFLPEFIQDKCTKENISEKLVQILSTEELLKFEEKYKLLWQKMGDKNPFENASHLILKILFSQK